MTDPLASDERFSRQMRFAPIGADGQRRIGEGRVLLVGLGALGTHLASTLVRAGVGTMWLVDRDVVEPSNLQRQLLFTEEDARRGVPKAVAAAERLRTIRAAARLHPITEDFSVDTYTALGTTPDLILDGTDNFPTRYLLNDLAVRDGVPWIYAGAIGAEGTAMAILPGVTPCLRCLIPQAPPAAELGTCETHGVLAPAIATVAAFQAAQALKILAGRTADVARGTLAIDVWRNFYALLLTRADPAPDCVACARREFPALHSAPRPAVSLCGRRAVQVHPRASMQIDLARVAEHLRDIAGDIELSAQLLRFSVEGCRFSVFRGGRAILFGIDDPARARILYDRYVGAL